MNRIEITRYGNRNWAEWLDGESLAVTVYKKRSPRQSPSSSPGSPVASHSEPSIHPCLLTQPSSCLP